MRNQKKRRINGPEFWLINKSFKKDVSVGDLRITIKSGEKKNLLSNHYNFSIEQLKASATTGSIHKKSDMLCVREIEPVSHIKPMLKEVDKRRVLVPLRNPIQKIDAERYEELDFEDEFMGMSEEQFAADQADAEKLAHAPGLSVDPNLTKVEEDYEE